ncbi:MAG TPA: N-acetylmuramic acid 6-phosphate etherase [Flavobacteriales bacterium]|jgi:N-acetylmuramic acid 6-phosphate etherase|nr:N-acetylmuramic acid 6-phosphate etherase [Flavobacteriales bacterium]
MNSTPQDSLHSTGKAQYVPSTEAESSYNLLEEMSIKEILAGINNEDHKVSARVREVLVDVELLVQQVVSSLKNGGRLFYIGAGTSGRLGILDASECPPTFGVSPDLVTGIIAGGDSAIRTAVEHAEDHINQGYIDLKNEGLQKGDVVIGIAASGTTPYVIGALEKCRKEGVITGCITCSPGSPITNSCDYPVVVQVGPEFITGSTRMKSGTAQKMVLNMITTTTMIQLGRVKGNRMVDMQLTNNKLIERGRKMLMEQLNINYAEASSILQQYGSVRAALVNIKTK